MTGEQIRRHFEATSFVPFRVHMASGRSADVPHPDFMHLSPSGHWLMVDLPDDTVEMIDVSCTISQACWGRTRQILRPNFFSSSASEI